MNDQYFNPMTYFDTFKIPITESVSDYDFDELLETFTPEYQEFLLSLPELPIGFMVEHYKEYNKTIKHLKD